MRNKVLIVDTSILCCLLNVDGKETCGSREDHWDKKKVESLLEYEKREGATLVLPLAAIIETGNHIAQSKNRRFECAKDFANIIKKTADSESPWAAFTEQSELWDIDELKRLADEWPELASRQVSIGDATIKTVAEYYSKKSFEVQILTGDAGLKAFEPVAHLQVPRRRS